MSSWKSVLLVSNSCRI